MNPPILRKGDMIHLAVPFSGNAAEADRTAKGILNAYKGLGIGVFMVDHVAGLLTPQVVAVVRGVKGVTIVAEGS